MVHANSCRNFDMAFDAHMQENKRKTLPKRGLVLRLQ